MCICLCRNQKRVKRNTSCSTCLPQLRIHNPSRCALKPNSQLASSLFGHAVLGHCCSVKWTWPFMLFSLAAFLNFSFFYIIFLRFVIAVVVFVLNVISHFVTSRLIWLESYLFRLTASHRGAYAPASFSSYLLLQPLNSASQLRPH